jgi:hypothetical protein
VHRGGARARDRTCCRGVDVAARGRCAPAVRDRARPLRGGPASRRRRGARGARSRSRAGVGNGVLRRSGRGERPDLDDPDAGRSRCHVGPPRLDRRGEGGRRGRGRRRRRVRSERGGGVGGAVRPSGRSGRVRPERVSRPALAPAVPTGCPAARRACAGVAPDDRSGAGGRASGACSRTCRRARATCRDGTAAAGRLAERGGLGRGRAFSGPGGHGHGRRRTDRRIEACTCTCTCARAHGSRAARSPSGYRVGRISAGGRAGPFEPAHSSALAFSLRAAGVQSARSRGACVVGSAPARGRAPGARDPRARGTVTTVERGRAGGHPDHGSPGNATFDDGRAERSVRPELRPRARAGPRRSRRDDAGRGARARRPASGRLRRRARGPDPPPLRRRSGSGGRRDRIGAPGDAPASRVPVRVAARAGDRGRRP